MNEKLILRALLHIMSMLEKPYKQHKTIPVELLRELIEAVKPNEPITFR